MKEYTGFAKVYDLFMDNVPYDEWTKYLVELLRSCNVNDGLVLELGCGTGNVTRRLSAAGYDMIGIDISSEMLQIAVSKQEDDKILYLQQDMREFELYGTVRAVVSICDSMNYLTSLEDLECTLKLVNNYLDPGGVFIFDMNTEHYYRDILGEQTICDTREEGSFIWENYYNEEDHINEFDMTIYYVVNSKGEEENAEHLYRRCNEIHFQKAYKLNEIIKLLNKTGLEFLGAYEALTKKTPDKNSERIYVCAEKRVKDKAGSNNIPNKART